MNEKAVFEDYYRNKEKREELAWHHADPMRFLPPAMEARGRPGTALDMGCGSGVDSVYMAKHGWQVTSLDFMDEALDMTRQLAADEAVELNIVQTDVLAWDNTEQFDLLLDAGLLHNMQREKIPSYKKKILDWLKPDGDFVLSHWESQSDHDRMFGGPRRATREQVTELFAPELSELKLFDRKEVRMCKVCEGDLCQHYGEHCRGIGPNLSIAYYWFRRP